MHAHLRAPWKLPLYIYVRVFLLGSEWREITARAPGLAWLAVARRFSALTLPISSAARMHESVALLARTNQIITVFLETNSALANAVSVFVASVVLSLLMQQPVWRLGCSRE